MLHFVTSYMKQNKSRKQTLESAQYGLEISFNKRKSLRVQQPARADIIHSNREIKEIFDPEKRTLSFHSEHKSA